MLPRQGVIPAHLRLHVVDVADVLFLAGQLAKPRAAADILSGLWMNPDIMDSRNHLIDPLENIVPSVLLPKGDILFRCAGLVGIEIKAAVAALLAGKFFWGHSISVELTGFYKDFGHVLPIAGGKVQGRPSAEFGRGVEFRCGSSGN